MDNQNNSVILKKKFGLKTIRPRLIQPNGIRNIGEYSPIHTGCSTSAFHFNRILLLLVINRTTRHYRAAALYGVT